MRWIRTFVISSPLMDILSAVVFALVLLYAREQIKHGVMTTGTFFTFVYALLKAYEPVKGMGGVYQQFEQTHGATTQVFGFLAIAGGGGGTSGSARASAILAPSRIRQGEFCLRSGRAHPSRHFFEGARRGGNSDCGIERGRKDHLGESVAALS